jgi:tetratricopeptide (TPR) repeat protein
VQKIDDYEWTVYTTWTVSFGKLSTQAATFLDICAFLHHDGISAEMFQKASANVKTRMLEYHQVPKGLEIAKDFLASFWSGDGHWDLHKFLTVMMEIRSYSLIDFDERNETYSIHPLVHAWTRSKVTDSAIIHESSQYILSMSIDAERGLKDIAFRRTLLPHVDASLRDGMVKDPDVAEWLCRPYFEGGRWRETEKLAVLVTESRKQDLGEEHPATLASIANLAMTYSRQGRWKDAEELEVRVMEMNKRVLGEDHPDVLRSMANLAITYSRQGRWKDAEELVVWVMEMNKRILGEDHPDTLRSMANLAITYSRQGRFKDAEELEVRVVEMSKRNLGEEHPDTVLSMANLAVTYLNLGRLKDAEALEVRVVEINKRVLGEAHPNTLTSMHNFALIQKALGRRKDAEELFVRVVEVSKRVLGEDHPHTLEGIVDLASLTEDRGIWKNVKKWVGRRKM